jgi:hypothetical protein
MKKALVYIYLLWVSVNIMVLAYAMANANRYNPLDLDLEFDDGSAYNSAFYPFETCDIKAYDLSEFLVYAIAVPLCLFAIAKLVLLFIPQKNENTNK